LPNNGHSNIAWFGPACLVKNFDGPSELGGMPPCCRSPMVLPACSRSRVLTGDQVIATTPHFCGVLRFRFAKSSEFCDDFCAVKNQTKNKKYAALTLLGNS